MTNFQRNWI